jgi:superfamily II DNA or RNA helicase
MLVDLVARHPGCTARELHRILIREGGPSLTKSRLNSALYSNPCLYYQSSTGVPKWYADCPPPFETLPLNIKASVWNGNLANISLYPWQQQALDWWRECGYQGVVEAITGAGKTRVALEAAVQQLRRGKPVVIVVPTQELLSQWEHEIKRILVETLGMRITIGFLGGGCDDNHWKPDVLITTVQSGYRKWLLPHSPDGLLIADETHRYGAEQWSRVLEEKFDWRLGLTATYEREDSGVEEFLNPYFGGNVFRIDYRRALDDEVIAPFKIAFVAVGFSPSERAEYEACDESARKYKRKLIKGYGLPEEPFGDFMREVVKLRSSEEDGARLAGFYLSAFAKRREVLADAREKFVRLMDLSAAIRSADRSILFAQTQEAARAAIDYLSVCDIKGEVLTSDMDMAHRKQVFAAFEDGDHELVAAPRLLDEGIDVPAADLAIVLASSRSRRQMVQRMGRVVRKKEDGRLARLVVLYVEDTSEDPEVAHEDFLYLVTDVAEDIRYFNREASADEICEYLNDWTSSPGSR